MLRVVVVCTDGKHPVNAHLERWADAVRGSAVVRIVRKVAEAGSGDFLFLVSCQEIVPANVRARFRHTLVLHASALPEGRGMSPHVWQLLEGRTQLTLTLLNAEDELDSGDIWQQRSISVPRSALFAEINGALFEAEVELLHWAIRHCDRTTPHAQKGEATRYRRRSPRDSEIDPDKPLREVFDLIRVSDPERYPAWFTLHGRTFRIRLEPLP